MTLTMPAAKQPDGTAAAATAVPGCRCGRGTEPEPRSCSLRALNRRKPGPALAQNISKLKSHHLFKLSSRNSAAEIHDLPELQKHRATLNRRGQLRRQRLPQQRPQVNDALRMPTATPQPRPLASGQRCIGDTTLTKL